MGDEAVGAALARSHLGRLPVDMRDHLLSGTRRVRVRAGGEQHREGDRDAHLEVVIAGLARVSVTAPDGRSMTVRYCRAGAILGAMSLYTRPFQMPATVQCLVDCEFLVLDAQRVRAAADRDPRVAAIILYELSERALGFITEIPGSVFASVRQRTARHLLDSATRDPDKGHLVVHLSQADLADSVGTAREVLVRVLRAMRREGLVVTRRGAIAIIDPVRLAGETYAVTVGGDLTDHWNQGS